MAYIPDNKESMLKDIDSLVYRFSKLLFIENNNKKNINQDEIRFLKNKIAKLKKQRKSVMEEIK